MIDLKSMTLEELSGFLRSMGEPAFRGRQVFTWLHKGVSSFDEMSNLSKALREKLKEQCILTVPRVAKKQVSARDGTIKYLWQMADGNCVESVLMRYHHGNTVCISSQVGCRMGCAFCASTIAGKVRNLTPAEMLDQVLFTQQDSGAEVSNIVLMGIGEPMDNLVFGAGESSGRYKHWYASYLPVYLRCDSGDRTPCRAGAAADSERLTPRAGQRNPLENYASEPGL